MAEPLIKSEPIATNTFNKLWNVTVCDYKYAGQRADFETIMVKISVKRATLIEAEIAPVSTIVQRRNEQLKKLGDALAELSRAQAAFTENSKPEDTQPTSDKTAALMRTLTKDTKIMDDHGNVTKSNCEMAIQLVKSKMDKLNNDSQSDTTRLQSLVTKRDDSFSTASTLMKGVSDTRGNAIRNMGQ